MTPLVSLALLILAGMLVAAVAIVARRKLGARHARAAAREAAVEATRRLGLLNPDWNAYERATGRRPPEVLRRLYANVDLVTAEDLVVTVPDRGDSPLAWEIAGFEPVRKDARAPAWPDMPSSAFHFASNWYGDPYYVVIGERPDGDGSVYVRVHDAEDAEVVAPSLAEFLSWPRHRAAPTGRGA
jgi:hypothetical protein